MRAYVRSLLHAALLLGLKGPAYANGLYLPPPPTGPGGEDRVETGSGARCSQSVNSNGSYLDVGFAGTTGAGGDFQSSPFLGSGDRNSSQGLGYARVTIPLGRRPARVDCTRLYEMELQRMQREIELLKMAAE